MNQPQSSPSGNSSKGLGILPIVIVAALAGIAYFAIPEVIKQMDAKELMKPQPNLVGTGNGEPPPGHVPPGGPSVGTLPIQVGEKKDAEKKEESKPAETPAATEEVKADTPAEPKTAEATPAPAEEPAPAQPEEPKAEEPKPAAPEEPKPAEAPKA